VDLADIDIVLVGDSVSMVVHGHDTTLPITLDDMLTHCKAVARGASRAFLIGDLPFGSYEQSTTDAVRSAIRMLKEGGMDAVKLEGECGRGVEGRSGESRSAGAASCVSCVELLPVAVVRLAPAACGSPCSNVAPPLRGTSHQWHDCCPCVCAACRWQPSARGGSTCHRGGWCRRHGACRPHAAVSLWAGCVCACVCGWVGGGVLQCIRLWRQLLDCWQHVTRFALHCKRTLPHVCHCLLHSLAALSVCLA
jgi:hypothetical protein